MNTGYLTGLIESNLNVSRETQRDYIGASLIGSPCYRQIWYAFNGHEGLPTSPKLKRTFEIGNRLEGMVIRLLKDAGKEVIEPDEMNHHLLQFDKDLSYFKGHADAILSDPEAILEVKTANDSSFNGFKNQGLQRWSPRYYSQIQSYMGMSGIEQGYLICLNKDTSELHDECVTFDVDYYERLKEKARIVHDAEVEPPRVNPSPFYFLCRMCQYRDECFKLSKD